MRWEVRVGDALEKLGEMPERSVQTCITSPPYWGLRDYGDEGQLGLEATPQEYVEKLTAIMREVRRVMRDDGTLWLNLGDSYAASSTYNAPRSMHTEHDWKQAGVGPNTGCPPGFKPKDLIGVPWRVAFALQADGWWLRSDIIWAKPNPMPESVTDRPTRSHEYLFLLTKSPRYFYDGEAVREEGKDWSVGGPGTGIEATHHYGADNGGNEGLAGLAQRYKDGEVSPTRNKRSVWTVATQPFPGAHFATFPPKLIEPCVLAGAPPDACERCGGPWTRIVRVEGETARDRRAERGESASAQAHLGLPGGPQGLNYAGGHGDNMRERATVGWEPSCGCDAPTVPAVVLDPFAGAGTTGVVALRRQRSFVGIELSPTYAEMARTRIREDGPLFNVAAEVT